MDPSDLVRILRETPQFNLRLTELAWEVVGEDGLDTTKIAFHAKELTEAIAEAEAYARETKEVVYWLIQLGRSQS